MIHWDEPAEGIGGFTCNIHCSATESDCVSMQIHNTPQHDYPNDEDALIDFMVIHWAVQLQPIYPLAPTHK